MTSYLTYLTYYDRIIFLTRNSDVQYIDFEGKVVWDINSLRKQELFHDQLAIDLNMVSPTSDQSQYKVKELKDLVKPKLSDQGSKSKNNYQSSKASPPRMRSAKVDSRLC